MMPALAIKMFSGSLRSLNLLANASTDCRSAKSSAAASTCPHRQLSIYGEQPVRANLVIAAGFLDVVHDFLNAADVADRQNDVGTAVRQCACGLDANTT